MENKPGTGALFKNERKQKDTHPDYTGKLILPDGKEMSLAGWSKESKSGKKYMSLSLSEPREQKEEEIF